MNDRDLANFVIGIVMGGIISTMINEGFKDMTLMVLGFFACVMGILTFIIINTKDRKNE